MTSLKAHLEEYLKLRRQLGFQLVVEGHLLKQFVMFASEEGTARITTDLVLRWVTKVPVIQCSLRAKRLSAVRQFAQYLSSVDPRTEVPPHRLLPDQSCRPTPHLFQDEQVVALIEAAQQIKSRQGLKGTTLATLFGLLAVTGMRVGEAIRLDRDDVDFGQAVVRVRQSKGNKERLVPLHTSTQQALRGYVALRNRVCPHSSCSRFFLSEGGTRLFHCTINRWFLRLCRQMGMRRPGDRRGPRLHGLRHRFAIQTLLRWYASNADVEVHMPELATFLGHVDVSGTYWYLSATPELLQLATERLAHMKGEYYR